LFQNICNTIGIPSYVMMMIMQTCDFAIGRGSISNRDECTRECQSHKAC